MSTGVTKRPFLLASLCAVLLLLGLPPGAGAADKVTIFLGLPTHHIAYTPFYVAEGLGFFKDEGLDVHLVPSAGSGAAAKNMMAGQGLLANTTPSTIFSFREKNIPIVSTFNIAQKAINKIVALEGSSVVRAMDFKGKTVGVASTGGAAHYDFLATARAGGVGDEDVKIVTVGFGPSSLQALLSKQIDVLATSITPFGIFAYQSRTAPWKLREIPNVGEELPSMSLATSEKSLATDRETITRVQRALAKAFVFMRTNVAAAIDVTHKVHPEAVKDKEMATAVFTESLKNYWSERGKSQPIGWHDPEAWSKTEEYFSKLGLHKDRVDVSRSYTNALLDKVNAFEQGRIADLARRHGK